MGGLDVVTVIEIGLLIAVWVRGWKFLSIVPFVLAVVAGFLAGMFQLPISDATFALFDTLGIAIWIVMLFLWPINLPRLGSILEAASIIPIGNMGVAVWPFGKKQLYSVVNVGQATVTKGELVQVVGRRGFKSTLAVTKYNVKQVEERNSDDSTET